MSLFKNFDVAGSAMSAQSLRLNITASNMANANTVAGSPEEAYRSRHPVFKSIYDDATEGAAVSVHEDTTEVVVVVSWLACCCCS